MTTPIDPNDKILWDDYVRALEKFLDHKAQLIRQSSDLKQVIEHGLAEEKISQALGLMRALNVEERKSFFERILEGASYQNPYHVGYRDLVLSFPKTWLLENIEKYAQPILSGKDKYEEYMCLMGLFEKIDKQLAIRLAQHGVESDDADIRELGQEVLKDLTHS